MGQEQVVEDMHYKGLRRRKERKKWAESLFKELIAGNFLNLGKAADVQIHEAPQRLKKINPKRSTPRHSIITLSKAKDKKRFLKALS